MKLMSEYLGENIFIAQTSVFKRNYEIRVKDEVVGAIQQMGFFGMVWDISIHNKKWEIYKQSIWRSTLYVRETGYEMPIANFTTSRFKSSGTLFLPKGENLKIVPHLFKGFCEIKNEHEECLARIIPKRISFKDKAEVVLEKRSELLDKYPWILIMAYIVIAEQRRRASHS